MTPTLDLSSFTQEQLAALGQLAQQQVLMTAPRPEPVDANKIENPNAGRNLPYPKMIFNHVERKTVIVKNQQEHQAFEAQGYVTAPFFETEDEPKVKSAGFEEEPDEVSQLREELAAMRELVQQSMAKKPMNRRSGE